ncbi:protein of unknown function [Acidithiobacillus ferrivorans]|uniref:Uncharacterized protein n=1 Tax=Acidithiobacillus ferrivorans TaxID=160808 RepID=A0A060USV1_9PROT|nr:conserved hypothetical protein [Acidithiobacillus ferrivorans]SMH66249.1 protein of unknown function [Acidithiobacillus ferrivorans]
MLESPKQRLLCRACEHNSALQPSLSKARSCTAIHNREVYITRLMYIYVESRCDAVALGTAYSVVRPFVCGVSIAEP